MELKITKDEIRFDKELNDLDIFTREFVDVLDRLRIKYVLISGYVAILFGRSRGSEDIDIFIEPLDNKRFRELWHTLIEEFDCVNAFSADEGFDFLKDKSPIRFSKKGIYVPNMEVSFPKDYDERWTFEHRKKVVMNGKTLFISPLETQIAYKLYLGSQKDIEDAIHLYTLFKTHLDTFLFQQALSQLKVLKEYNKHLASI